MGERGPWCDALEAPERYRMLCRFEKHDLDAGSVVFLDTFPPFGVVEIAESTWRQLGQPRELRATLEVVGAANSQPQPTPIESLLSEEDLTVSALDNEPQKEPT